MSLFDDASLVMIPSAYKDGKLYSIKPTDGSGDFTFTRGSNLAATRVNSSGLIEKGRENLLLQSNQFDTTWGTNNASITSGQIGYDGSSDAWLLSKTDSNALISQSVSKSGVQTYSIYAKAGTLSWCRFLITATTGNQSRYFDLSTGTKGGSGYGTEIDSTITSVGSGWHRITLTFNESTTSVRIYPADGNLDISGTSGNILIQDAQLEQGLVATDYIETTTTTAQAGILEDMPRLDYSGGASCPSLKLEPQRTNLIVNSEYLTGTAGTSTFNEITSPEGVDNGLLFVEDTATTTHGFLRPATIPTNASAVNYTISIFAKKKEREYIQLTFFAEGVSTSSSGFNLINGTTSGDSATHKIEDYGNGWYRCSFTASILQSTGAYNFSRVGTGSNEFTFYYAGDGTSGMYFYGFQVESGSYPTSYIPTYGTSQTRSSDACSKTGISSLIGQTEGTLFMDVNLYARDSFTYFALAPNLGSTSSYIGIGITATAFSFEVINSGVQVAYNYSNSSTGNFKLAFAYKANDFVAYVNGTQVMTDTSGSVPACSQIGLNHYDKNQTLLYKQALVFKTRLLNEELEALTTL
jgi:hypothetical protein